MPVDTDESGESPLLRDDRRGAQFSDDREFRYRLWRTWDANQPTLAFIMLNPSTADETSLDPTCRRCKGYAQEWGFGSLVVGNIFALRATDPDELYDHSSPVGPENDEALRSIVGDAHMTVAAWGHHGDLQERGREVCELLSAELHALDTTQDGHPVHPLYQPADAEPERFHAGVISNGE